MTRPYEDQLPEGATVVGWFVQEELGTGWVVWKRSGYTPFPDRPYHANRIYPNGNLGGGEHDLNAIEATVITGIPL